jgi:hypothetical protein
MARIAVGAASTMPFGGCGTVAATRDGKPPASNRVSCSTALAPSRKCLHPPSISQPWGVTHPVPVIPILGPE